MSKSFSIYPLAGIDNASPDDDRLQVGGDARRNYLRDAVNVDITDTGRVRMRKGRRKVSDLALSDLWQSPLHGDVFGRLGEQWVRVDPQDWSTEALATIGPGPVSHLVLNGQVLAAGSAGIWQFDGRQARRLALDVPPAPLVSASDGGSGALEAGSYGVAVAWLRGAQESPLSAMTSCTVAAAGALSITLPMCMDPTVTHARLYLTRHNGGELLRGEDYPIGTAWAAWTLLPTLGAPAPFRHMQPMPTGQYLGLWRGRLVTAWANVLRFSEALAYHVNDPLHGFVQMPQRITFVQPVDGGIWVGQVDHVAFLAGAEPAELVLSHKTGKAPVPGSAVALDAETAGELSAGGAAAVAWLAANGFVLGSPDGQLLQPQARRIRGITGNRATSIVFGSRLLAAVT